MGSGVHLLTRESPTFCIWTREGVIDYCSALYAIRPLARIEILTNKQTHEWTSLRFIRGAVSPFYVCTCTAGSFTTADEFTHVRYVLHVTHGSTHMSPDWTKQH